MKKENLGMDYREIFKMQWRNFCNEFVLNSRKSRRAGLASDKMDEWYHLSIQRFLNIGQYEGETIRNLLDTEAADEFLNRLMKFNFRDEKMKDLSFDEKKPLKRGLFLFFISIFIPIYSSLHIELPFTFIEVPMWKPILFGVSLGSFSIIKTYRDTLKTKDEIDERIRNEYLRQLVEHGEDMVRFYESVNTRER